MMRRVHNQPKWLRIRIQSQDKEPVTIGEAIIQLPADFVNFNAACPWMLRIDTEIERPADIPRCEPQLPEPLPTDGQGQPLPYYPYNFTLTDEDMIRQTDYYAVPISGVISFVDFR